MLPPGVYLYHVAPFFDDNLLWEVREIDLGAPVDHIVYTHDTFNVAAAFATRLFMRGIPMSHTRIVAHLRTLVDKDDFADVYFLNGTRLRNIQRQLWLP